MTNRQLFSGALSVKHLSHNYLTARLSQLDLNIAHRTRRMYPSVQQNKHPFSQKYNLLFKNSIHPWGDLLRFVPNIKNGVEIKFHCDSDSLGQMWLIGIGH